MKAARRDHRTCGLSILALRPLLALPLQNKTCFRTNEHLAYDTRTKGERETRALLKYVRHYGRFKDVQEMGKH